MTMVVEQETPTSGGPPAPSSRSEPQTGRGIPSQATQHHMVYVEEKQQPVREEEEMGGEWG